MILPKSEKFWLTVIIGIIILSYLPLFKGFFQQDEWYGYAWFILHKDLNFLDKISFFFSPSVGHYNPLSILTTHTLFSIWNLDYTKFLVLSIFSHLIMSISVFYLAKLFFKDNRLLSLATCLLFALFASHQQATSWVVANIATQWSSILGIIATILFFKFVEEKKQKLFILSLLILGVSLLFKEITIGLFPYFFIYLILNNKGKTSKNQLNKKHLVFLLLFGFGYMVFRFSMIFASNITGDTLVTQSQSVVKIIYNFLTVPFKSLSQAVFTHQIIRIVSNLLAGFFPDSLSGPVGSPQFETFVVKRVMEVTSILTALFMLGVSLIVAKLTQKNVYKDAIILSLLWVFFNSLIFSLTPERGGVIFVVDSRNLYFIGVGVAIFLVAFLKTLIVNKPKKFVKFFIILLFFNLLLLNDELSKLSEIGEMRKNILVKIKSIYPVLPKKTVFLVESDSPYYGLPEKDKIPPFQSGFGHTLLGWYYVEQKFPKEFYEDRFLWEITSQGYKEQDGIGFGYFRDYGLLKRATSDYHVPVDNIISFSWSNITNRLENTTPVIRERIKFSND